MENNSKIYSISFVFAILALVMIALSVFLFNAVVEKSIVLASDKGKIASLKGKFNDIQNFKNNYDTYKPNLDKIDQLYIDSQNPVDFIEFVENAAAKDNLNLEMLPPSFSTTGSLTAADFQLSFIGEIPQIVEFLKIIENSPYLVKIKELDIKTDKNIGSAKKQQTSQTSGSLLLEAIAK